MWEPPRVLMLGAVLVLARVPWVLLVVVCALRVMMVIVWAPTILPVVAVRAL